MKITAGAKMVNGRLQVVIDIQDPDMELDEKFNPNHGSDGRFSTYGAHGSIVTPSGESVYDMPGGKPESKPKPASKPKPEPKPKKPESAEKPKVESGSGVAAYSGKVKVAKGKHSEETTKVLEEIAEKHPALVKLLAKAEYAVKVGVREQKEFPKDLGLSGGGYIGKHSEPGKREVVVSSNNFRFRYDAEPFSPGTGKSEVVADSGVTIKDKIRITMVHELAHHLQEDPGFKKNGMWNKYVQPLWERAATSQKFVTNYASTHPKENFSELVAAYMTHPDKLKKFDPKSHKLLSELFS